MKALAILAIVVTTVTLATIATVAIWASIADAPWEDASTEEAAATPAPKPPAKPTANFTKSDVISLAQRQVAEQSFFPGETRWVRCVDASYRSGNSVWVVTCEFRINRDDLIAEQERTYTFDDRTGNLK